MPLQDNEVVRDFFATSTVVTETGERVAAHSQLPLALAEALYRTVLTERSEACLEVGLGFGASTLAILAALDQLGRGRLTSIDPKQTTQFGGAGLVTIERAGFAPRHRLIEEPSHLALPQLLRENAHIDLAYIDGWHTFDYTLVDLFYIDKILRVGGVVGFNDCWFQSVHRVIGFLLTHRRYEEIEVGLPKHYVGYRRRTRIKARLRGIDLPLRNFSDRYFRKLEDWEPNWDFYADF